MVTGYVGGPGGMEQMLLIMTQASEVCIAGKSAVAGERENRPSLRLVICFCISLILSDSLLFCLCLMRGAMSLGTVP